MIEREMQELIWEHPERFFNEPLKQFAWEASSGIGRADLVFEDRHGRLLIIEVKKGKLPRGAIDQLHDYFGMMKQKYPNKAVEMMVVAWAIPQERRLACEHYDIDCREFSEKSFRDIAAEYGYLFASESQTFEKKPESGGSLKGMELIAPATEVMDKVGMSGESVVHNWVEISDKSKVDVVQEVAALPIPSALQRAVKNDLPDSKTLLLPVLRIFADGVEHTSEEIGKRIIVQFQIAPLQLLQKHNDRISVFQNNVALALANLQGAPHKGPKCIEKVRKKVYRITEYGKTILKRNPSSLTIKDL
jgi:hypothetical protein